MIAQAERRPHRAAALKHVFPLRVSNPSSATCAGDRHRQRPPELLTVQRNATAYSGILLATGVDFRCFAGCDAPNPYRTILAHTRQLSLVGRKRDAIHVARMPLQLFVFTVFKIPDANRLVTATTSQQLVVRRKRQSVDLSLVSLVLGDVFVRSSLRHDRHVVSPPSVLPPADAIWLP